MYALILFSHWIGTFWDFLLKPNRTRGREEGVWHLQGWQRELWSWEIQFKFVYCWLLMLMKMRVSWLKTQSVWRWLQLVQNPEILKYDTVVAIMLRYVWDVVNFNVKIILDHGQLKGGWRGGEKASSLQASSPCKTSSSCKNAVIIHHPSMYPLLYWEVERS